MTVYLYIKSMANILPDEFYNSSYVTVLSGEDALLCGHVEIGGEKVEVGKKYNYSNTLVRDVNHKLRMKKAFKNRGKEGLKRYIELFTGKNDDLTNFINKL